MNSKPVFTGQASRRAFLQRCGALGALGASPLALSLAGMAEASAQSANDYKALVCVFLYGGNDQANTLVPCDSASHAQYQALRSNIAIARSSLDATVLRPDVALPDGQQYALAPGLAPLLPLFDAGQLAVLLNVGPLAQPTTKAEYLNRSVPLPPKLFSHNDQQSLWQSLAAEGATSGWGGRMGDLLASGNGNATFTNISVTGNAVFLNGSRTTAYNVTPSGPVAVAGIQSPLFGSAACSDLLRSLMTADRSDLLENEYVRVSQRAIAAQSQVASGLAGVPALKTVFPAGNGLANQLAMVARLIAARGSLGARRQVFMVSLGGFDTHDNLLRDHPGLMATVGNAMRAFQDAMGELGVAQQVTTFTASDFGRTLLSNNSGSDHGWGSMQWVMGGAVKGRGFVGRAPVLANNGPDDVGQGRLLPQLGVDPVAATLAQWLGVSALDQALILPNLSRFSQTNLGFMAPG